MTGRTHTEGRRLALLALIAAATCPPMLMADTYETSWTVPRWRLQADVGLTPYWIYDASGLFYSGLQVRTMQEPDLKIAIGLGAGYQFGVRWNLLRGVGFTMKRNLSGSPGAGTALFSTVQLSPPPDLTHGRGSLGVRVGCVTGREGLGVGYSTGLSVAGSCVHGPAVNDNVVREEPEGPFAGLSVLWEFGVPIRFGRDHALRILPVLAQEYSVRRVILGYDEFLGYRYPITASWVTTLGISLSYSPSDWQGPEEEANTSPSPLR